MVPDFAIIADDLTGAADSGVQFARNGHPTTIYFEGESVQEDAPGVVVIDTDSRAEDPGEAARRVTHAAGTVTGEKVWFKKVDSTLRGNVAAEVGALMEATGLDRAVVAPAFPAAGRTTSGGMQLLHGTPVHETELARDPKTPVATSDLRRMMPDPSQTVLLGAEDIVAPQRIASALRGGRYVISDATEDSHLASLVEAFDQPSSVLWVGSAGLSGALASSFPGGVMDSLLPTCESPLVVVGSMSEVSRRQMLSLGSERSAALLEVGPECGPVVQTARKHLSGGGVVVLHSPSRAGASPSEVTRMLASAVESLAGSFDGLVLTGGDTAVGVAKSLGATGMRVLGEVEPGVPYGVLTGGVEYPVVTKAGAFGSPGTLCAAVDSLTGRTEGRQG